MLGAEEGHEHDMPVLQGAVPELQGLPAALGLEARQGRGLPARGPGRCVAGYVFF